MVFIFLVFFQIKRQANNSACRRIKAEWIASTFHEKWYGACEKWNEKKWPKKSQELNWERSDRCSEVKGAVKSKGRETGQHVMHWTWCINRFCEAPGSIGHTSALAKLRDWPGKHSLLTNSFALTVSIESTAFKMGRNVMQAHVKEKKTALLHPTVPGKQSYCQHLCNGQEYATKAGKQGHVKACLGKALWNETVAIPGNIYLRPSGWENRSAKQSKYEVDNAARDGARSQSGTFWALLMLKCTGYAEGTTAIHARNSVRVAQTTAISPAAPAHRTAWSAHLPTRWESKTSSETEKGCAQISAVVNHQNRRRSTRKKNARSRSFSSRLPLQGLNWKRHRWMQRRPGVHEDRIPGEMIQEMEPVLTRFWPGLIGQTPKIFVSNNASLSFGSSFTLDDYEHLTFSAKTCQDCQFGED